MDNMVKHQDVYQKTVNRIKQSSNLDETVGMKFVTASQDAMSLKQDLDKSQELLAASVQTAKLNHKERFNSALADVQETAKANQQIRGEVAKLMERCAELESELAKTSSEMEQVDSASSQVFHDAMRDVPMEKYICSLLKNITNIEWDVASCKDNAVAKGTFVRKNEIRPFDFDLSTEESHEVQEKLWSRMEGGQKFASFVDLGT